MAIRLDPNYALSIPWGLMRLAEFIVGIIVVICVAVVDYPRVGDGFITFVAVGSLITALVILILYCLHIPDTIDGLPWALAELGTSVAWTILYVIAGCVASAFSAQRSRFYSNSHACYGAAAFFCFLAALIFGLNAFLQYSNWRSAGPITVSGGTTTRTTYEHTTVTTGAYPTGGNF